MALPSLTGCQQDSTQPTSARHTDLTSPTRCAQRLALGEWRGRSPERERVVIVHSKTIVIADDDAGLRNLVKFALTGVAERLLEAADGSEALAVSRREHPDVILLDIGMPGLDGYEVCVALKRDPNTSDTRVAMLTARAQSDDRIAGWSCGADDYITKPFSPVDLIRRVERLLIA